MLQDRIAERYAKAAFEHAVQKKAVVLVVRDFKSFEQIYEESPEFRTFLRSPLIRAEKKRMIYEKLFERHASEVTNSLMHLLIEKRRESVLPVIISRFLEYYHLQTNQTKVELVCSEPLPKALKAELITLLEAQLKTKVIMRERINPEIIDGFQLIIGGMLYDASVAGDLRRIRNLLNAPNI